MAFVKLIEYHRTLVVLLAIATLAGCGFQLRGHAPLPQGIETLELQLADPNGELGRALRPLLRANGAVLVDEGAENAAVLTILDDRMNREILTVSHQARVSEYLLRYHVRFRLAGPGGNMLVTPTSLEVRQDYTFNEGVVLAKEREEDLLRETLYERMARLILLRMSTDARAD